jgi:hypothetical protein
MPIPQTTLKVCDKPADDYAYALMIGCIRSGFSFSAPSRPRMKPCRLGTSTWNGITQPRLSRYI